ncbi:MAG: glycosyltransferase family 2 protein [Butyrivibrio sp.]|nr:glycosyltransferase family 2 protein [Butyrivibrio sp.]
MTTKSPKLIIVIPCYNEEEVLPITAPLFLNKIQSLVSKNMISEGSKVLFVNDGSKDRTWEIITDLSNSDKVYEGICLSRNRGHQNALLAGLMYAKDKCDITISIDCDGQDDIDAMDKMVEEYLNGAEIVYGVRDNRDSDTFFKRSTAQGYYKLLNKMGAEVVYNHADYRLASSKVLKEFSKFDEVNIYLRGMFPLVGFKSTCVYYKRHERLSGKSHYPISKMLTLAIDGITSLSIKPIRIITGLGILMAIVSLVLIIYVFVSYFSGNTVHGWSSNVIIVLLIGGIQMISLGVIGEYVGKIYLETKHRPKFIISETTENSDIDNK